MVEKTVDKFARVLVVLFFGCICIGIINAAFKPEPEVIHTKPLPAEIIYKDRVQTKVVKEVAPYPSSCTAVLGELDEIIEGDRKLTRDSEDLAAFARSAPLQSYYNPNGSAAGQEKINALSESIQAHLMEALDGHEEVKISFANCQADIAEANESN